MAVFAVNLAGIEAYAAAKFLELARTDIRGHDDYGVLEVDTATEAVGKAPFVHNLEEKVEHVGVSLFDFVEEHHRIGVTTDTLGKLASLFVAYVSRRRTDESRHAEFFHIFAHVDTYERVGTVEEVFGEFLCKMGLADTGRAEEHKRTDRLVGVFKAETVALDSLDNLGDGLVLANDGLLEGRAHFEQAQTFGLGYALHGYAGHHCHDFGNLVGIDRLAVSLNLFVPFLACLVEVRRYFGSLVA